MIPASETDMATFMPSGIFDIGLNAAVIKVIFKIVGKKAGRLKMLCVFITPEKSVVKAIQNKKGNVHCII